MAHTTGAVMQTPWDCRWGAPGHEFTHVDGTSQPEGRWVCTHPTPAGGRRTITENECATCGYWTAVDRHAEGLSVLQRTVLVLAGLLLFAAGAALAAPLILLPLGLPLAAIGLGIVMWGLSGAATTGTTRS